MQGRLKIGIVTHQISGGHVSCHRGAILVCQGVGGEAFTSGLSRVVPLGHPQGLCLHLGREESMQ